MGAIKRDCRSTTGGNLRNLMKITMSTSIDDITLGCTRGLLYKPVPEGDEWQIHLAKDLIDMKSERQGLDLAKHEIEEILNEITT